MRSLRPGKRKQAQPILRGKEHRIGVRPCRGGTILVAAILGCGFRYSLFAPTTADDQGIASFFGNDQQAGNATVVAYAISLTDCGESALQRHYLVDAAAVLRHSIHLTSRQNPASDSRYDYQMYAFVHRDAREECAPVIPALERLQYTVQWKTTPFALDQIRHPILKEKIHKQGCCGEKEFIKLYTLQLTGHPVAVHLDLDTLVLKKLDYLYDTMLHTPTNNEEARALVQRHVQPHNAKNDAPQNVLPQDIISYFTRDYNMAMTGSRPTRVGMQGGFWVVRPNETIFRDIVSMVVDHGVHYKASCGWGGCKIGHARFYGGAGFQGVISYYYTYFLGSDRPKGPPTVDSPPPPVPHFVELDRCLYNSMADHARKACYQKTKGDVAACNHCNDTDFTELHGVHFTLCQKPWLCPHIAAQQLCYRFHHAWHAIREDFVRQQAGNTTAFDLDDPMPDLRTKKQYSDRITSKFPKQCKKIGRKGYIPMNFLNSSVDQD